MSRETIRQAFKSAVESVYEGQIYTSRITDNRDDDEYISIYIEGGEHARNFSGIETEARITVSFYKKQPAEDSELDQVVDPIIDLIPGFPAVLSEVKNPLLESFGYESDGKHNGISHTFRVIY